MADPALIAASPIAEPAVIAPSPRAVPAAIVPSAAADVAASKATAIPTSTNILFLLTAVAAHILQMYQRQVLFQYQPALC